MTSYKIRCEMPFCGARGEQTECSKNTKIVAFALGIILTPLGVATLLAPHIFTIGATAGYASIGVGAVALLTSAYLRCTPYNRVLVQENHRLRGLPVQQDGTGGSMGLREVGDIAREQFRIELNTWATDRASGGLLQEAVERIQRAFDEDQTELFLDDLGLNAFPRCITKLVKLQSLSLRGNHFTTIPEDIILLPNLHTLDVSCNGWLKEIPQEVLDHFSKKGRTLVGFEGAQAARDGEGSGPTLSARSAGSHVVGVGALAPTPRDRLQEELTLWIQNPKAHGKKIGAAQTILHAFTTGATKLELGGYDLDTLPKCICHLSTVEHVGLNGNRFESVPLELCSMPNFVSFNMGYHDFTDFPHELLVHFKKQHDAGKKVYIDFTEMNIKNVRKNEILEFIGLPPVDWGS